ncbi:MAG: hypothetical protein GWO16_09940 [Gammaproteobacteria bacterium]|nr:hypothetical protein [Gammaproteobacteria bacterium]NIR98846.1 hypothetical protein [Gammaproteobacteria bacterium]NIT63967.1 hypothetical protein [Gammaproteobacteria bacterium]NIV19127.1 hypothetical protein [Gammaproteobacteria bacterium]NIX10296.1 hypothetical protein [Gammaproteobacteria bacterium]
MIPTPLYESLPVIYITAGIFTIAALGTLISVIPGTLLIMAGLMVLYMRSIYRSSRMRR